MSQADYALLSVFRTFRVGPGEMLCFYGPLLDKHRTALRRLTDEGLLVEEKFKGGYSLTDRGFTAMKTGMANRAQP